jgi:hypothetical protein
LFEGWSFFHGKFETVFVYRSGIGNGLDGHHGWDFD